MRVSNRKILKFHYVGKKAKALKEKRCKNLLYFSFVTRNTFSNAEKIIRQRFSSEIRWFFSIWLENRGTDRDDT